METSSDKEKNLTAECAEAAEIFFQKTKKKSHFMNILSSQGPPRSLRFVGLFSFWRGKIFL
jgi:hypothetical protein